MRSRNLKPGFFKNEDLAELGFDAMILFQGLWCLADKEGRLEDRPRRIRIEVFPYHDLDVDKVLSRLCIGGFINRYEVDGERYIQVVNFKKHQTPHPREKTSTIPPCPEKAMPRHDQGTTQEEPRHDQGNTEATPEQDPGISQATPFPSDVMNPDIMNADVLKGEGGVGEGENIVPDTPPVDNSGQEDSNPAFYQELKSVLTEISKAEPNLRFQRQVLLFVESNKMHSNPDAIIHCLRSLLKALQGEITVEKPRAYLEAALKIEDGKHNARDHDAQAQEFKKPIKPGEMNALGNVLRGMANPP
jgi:hypothetical protein